MICCNYILVSRAELDIKGRLVMKSRTNLNCNNNNLYYNPSDQSQRPVIQFLKFFKTSAGTTLKPHSADWVYSSEAELKQLQSQS